MPSVNRVILIGNLTRDPELRHLPSGTSAVAEFGLAVNRKYKTGDGEQREEVCFIDCAAFGKAGELIHQYCTKGKPLFVEGRLRWDSWEDKNGGGKRSKLSVVVENFQFLGGRDGGDGEREPAQPAKVGAGVKLPARKQNPAPQRPFGDEQHFEDQDIPFSQAPVR